MKSHMGLDVLILLMRTHAFVTTHGWESFSYDSD